MVNEIEWSKAYRFGKLEMPVGLDAAAVCFGNGISVRGIRVYDIGADGYEPGYLTRFDVLLQ